MKCKDYGHRFPMRPIVKPIATFNFVDPHGISRATSRLKELRAELDRRRRELDAEDMDPDDITAAMWPWALESIAARDAEDDQ